MQHHRSNSIRRSSSVPPFLARFLSAVLAGVAGLTVSSAARAQLADPADTSEPVPAIQPSPAPAPDLVPDAAPQPAADLVDPALRAKLKLTIDAYAQAKSLSFRSKSSYTGFLDGKSPSTHATVRMARSNDNPSAWLIQSRGTGRRKPADLEVDFDAVWGPASIAWLDTATKKLMERPAGQGRGPTVQMAAGTVPTQITERIPFSKENVAESLTLDSADPVGGVACELLTVRPKGKHGSIKLWIGTDDHLIRKVERVSESASYGSSSIIEITDLKLDEGVTLESLKIELPEGYERDTVVIPTPTSEGNESEVAPTRPGAPGAPVASPESNPTPGSIPGSSSELNSGSAVPLSILAPNGDQPTRPAQPALPLMPAFSATAPDGTKVTLETIRGQPSVLFFFGTWSIASRSAEPELFKALDEVKSASRADGGTIPEIKIYAFAVRERTKDAGLDFMASTAHAATVIARGDELARTLAVRVFPTFVIVDAQGMIQSKIEGFRRETTPAELVNALKVLAGLKPSEATPSAETDGTTAAKLAPGSASEATEAETQGQ